MRSLLIHSFVFSTILLAIFCVLCLNFGGVFTLRLWLLLWLLWVIDNFRRLDWVLGGAAALEAIADID